MEPTVKRLHFSLESINSFSHGLGIIFGIIAMPILMVTALRHNHVPAVTGAAVYGSCFLMLFTFSTLYHGINQPIVKEKLKILDHISIYFLIAGTYTPFILIYVNNNFGISLLIVLWSLTILGIFFKLFFTGKFELLSTGIYILMGWILFAGGKTFFSAMPAQVITLLATGGVLYSLGVIFYLWQKLSYHHIIWHLFVLAAAICHYAAILISV